MLNSKKWSLFTPSQMISPVLLIIFLLTSAPLLQTAHAKSHQSTTTAHKKKITKPHIAKRKIASAPKRPTSMATQNKKTPSSPLTSRKTLPYPVFTEDGSNRHNLALVNALHLSSPSPTATTLSPARNQMNTAMMANNRAITPAQKKLVEFVGQTVYNLNYSSYRLGGGRFDTSRGIYVLDCSRFVDSVLSRVYPAAYSSLQYASGAERPASQHYYDFFSDLPRSSDTHWNKIEKIGQLRPGDILVFRYKKPRGRTQGHVMVVMDKPRATNNENAWMVRVADSAPTRHSADTRQHNESGIGIGTMLLKPAATGKPVAYAWGMGSSWNKNVKFAMARPLKMDA